MSAERSSGQEILIPSFKWAIPTYLGSNGDHDADYVLGNLFHQDSRILHTVTKPDLSLYDAIFIPGGFAFGDALRAGAIAAIQETTDHIKELAAKGKPVIGVCNGFQVLTESHLLPGALMRNAGGGFQARLVHVRVENNQTLFTNQCKVGQVLGLFIAHGEGNYVCDNKTLRKLRKNKQIVFRYCDKDGNVTPEANPNGAIDNIAGIINEQGNVLGLMPHPERSSEKQLGTDDGRYIIASMICGMSKK